MATGWQIVICTLYTQYTHLYIVGFFGLALLFQLLLLCLKAKRFWLRLDCLESESIGGLDWIVKRQTIWLCLLCLYLCAFVSVGGRLCVCVGMDSVFFFGGLGADKDHYSSCFSQSCISLSSSASRGRHGTKN